jgi:hypothetical protein
VAKRYFNEGLCIRPHSRLIQQEMFSVAGPRGRRTLDLAKLITGNGLQPILQVLTITVNEHIVRASHPVTET